MLILGGPLQGLGPRERTAGPPILPRLTQRLDWSGGQVLQDYFCLLLLSPPLFWLSHIVECACDDAGGLLCSLSRVPEYVRKECEVRCLVQFRKGLKHQTLPCGLHPVSRGF